MKTYVVTPHYNRLDETVLMMGHKICFYGEIWLIISELSLLPLLIWSTDIKFVNCTNSYTIFSLWFVFPVSEMVILFVNQKGAESITRHCKDKDLIQTLVPLFR